MQVVLETPSINESSILFHMPKIIPGTYKIADYGQYVHDLKAFDKKGKELEVIKQDVNTWRINNSKKLDRITYTLEDSWDSKATVKTYSMAGTNIEENKNFVINTPGFFGYFEGMREIPFDLSFIHPDNFYGSTALVAKTSANNSDEYVLPNVDALYDSPIMYNIPDTTSFTLGSSTILVSVYSPKEKSRICFSRKKHGTFSCSSYKIPWRPITC